CRIISHLKALAHIPLDGVEYQPLLGHIEPELIMEGSVLADKPGHYMAVFLLNYILADDGCHRYLYRKIPVIFKAHSIGFLPAQLPFVIAGGKLSHVA